MPKTERKAIKVATSPILTEIEKGFRVAFGHGELLTDDVTKLLFAAACTGDDLVDLLAVPAVPAHKDFPGQLVLAGKMTIDGRFSHPGRLGDITHADAIDAARGKKGSSCLHDSWSLRVGFLSQNIHSK